MSGINFDGKVNSITNSTGATPAGKTSQEVNVGAFGFGNPNSLTVGLERNIPGLVALTDKFNFTPPEYNKNMGNLVIAESDYIPDGSFEENPFCEV